MKSAIISWAGSIVSLLPYKNEAYCKYVQNDFLFRQVLQSDPPVQSEVQQ